MNHSERIWRGSLGIGAAILIIALSVTERSILGGVVMTIILFAVTAAVLFAGYLLVGAVRQSGGATGSDWADAETPAGKLRGLARALASRPWRAGAGILTVANVAITGRSGTLVSPMGHRLAAPVLHIAFNPRDLAAATARWPADVLAAEYATGYVEHTRRTGLKRVADETVLHVLADPRVPIGRVVVTPAFGPANDVDAVATARAVNSCPPGREGDDLDPSGDVPWNRQDEQWTLPPQAPPTMPTRWEEGPTRWEEGPTRWEEGPTRWKEELV